MAGRLTSRANLPLLRSGNIWRKLCWPKAEAVNGETENLAWWKNIFVVSSGALTVTLFLRSFHQFLLTGPLTDRGRSGLEREIQISITKSSGEKRSCRKHGKNTTRWSFATGSGETVHESEILQSYFISNGISKATKSTPPTMLDVCFCRSLGTAKCVTK